MNVHFDVLESVFARLDAPDLAAAALVSRAFLAGALPALYARIEYTAHHAKRAGAVMSPFATLAAHAHLAVHVKRIAVHAGPTHPSALQQINPTFLHDLALALTAAVNLRAFVCTLKILAPLLHPLLDKHRLSHLRICAALGSRQVAILQERTGLQSLSIDAPSWNVVDILPKWTVSMQKTLVHLTLFMSQDIDASVFNTTLAQLPRLRGLHVISCPRLIHPTVLKALSHTPNLRELSFSIFPSQEDLLPPLNFALPPLTHLSIDVRAYYPSLNSLVARIISRLSPRDALAICGGWIGEIRSASDRTDPPHDTDAPDHHIHVHPTPGHNHGHGQVNDHDPPLLSPPIQHQANNNNPNQHGVPPPPNLANQGPPYHFMGIPFPIPPHLSNVDDDDGDDFPNPGPPDPNLADENWPSLISSLPPTLSVLHLPQISPAALQEVLERCPGIELLGIAIGSSFAPPNPAKAKKTSGPSKPHPQRAAGIRPEISALASILSRVGGALRELIIDTDIADLSGNGPGSSSSLLALLNLTSVRLLMRESPRLRRIVGEGRIWESSTPTPSTPIPFPSCIDIELTLSRARYGPGAGNNHAHGLPSLGFHGCRYGQVEGGNDHWFWLTGSESAGHVYTTFY